MAEADFPGAVAGLATYHEAGQPFANRIVDVEFAALDKQHGHGGGGDYFGEAGHVVDRVGRNGGRGGLIREAAERVLENN